MELDKALFQKGLNKMAVNIYNEYSELDINEDRYNEIFKNIKKVLNKDSDYDLSLTFVDDAKILEINRDYRNIDKATDVISFAILDDNELPQIEGIEVDLGDIFISIDTAKKQAENLNQTLLQELEFLFVHGVLHLFGYDHMNEEDETEMFTLQRKIIDEINQ